MRPRAIFSLLLLLATGFLTYGAKFEVERLQGHLAQLRGALAADRNQIRVLRAEWNYLNRPTALAALNKRYLALVPVSAKQLSTPIAAIPLREAPVAVAVAAATPIRIAVPAAAAPDAAKRAPQNAPAGVAPLAQAKTIGELIASLAVMR